MRGLGKTALGYSNQWMKRPVQIASAFADALLLAELGVKMTDVDEAMQHTLYVNALLAGVWASCGFPTVTLGHRTAAAFAATRMRPADASEFVRSPWPAFGIRLPSDLLFVEANGKLFPGTFLIVCSLPKAEVPMADHLKNDIDEYRWWFKLLAQTPMIDAHRLQSLFPTMDPNVTGYFDGVCLWGFNLGTRHLAAENPDTLDAEGTYEHWETMASTDVDTRTDRIARSLILATSLYLSGDPKERAERGEADGIKITERKSKQREGDHLPPYTQYEVTSSITINLHHAVRDYVKQGGASPSVQTLVAGHWKRVPCGPKGANRKLVHVRPYWRGDVDAPISMRTK